MGCGGESPKIWRNVPDGSQLCLSIDPSDDQYAQDVCLRVNATSGSDCDEKWERAEVTPGPKCRVLSAPNRYDLEIRIDFLGGAETTVEVRAEIKKRDGASHGTPLVERHSGKAGLSCETIIGVFTRASGR